MIVINIVMILQVLERCADDYHVWIKEGISVKKTESEIAEGDSSWIEMRSPDNQIFFYNPESKELVWVRYIKRFIDVVAI